MDINNMVFAGRFNLLRYVAERASVFPPAGRCELMPLRMRLSPAVRGLRR
jgi:hypothetical protein